MKLKGVWGASLVLVALAASSCDEEQSAPPQPAPAKVRKTRQEIRSSDDKVLILGTSVNGGEASREAQAVQALGFAPTVVDAAAWSAMTAEQFMTYRAIIIGDGACQPGDFSAIQAAIDNRNVWGAIVDGNVVITGANPSSNGTEGVIENSMALLLEEFRAGRTGMYVSLGCAYQNAAPDTEVELLQPFGPFKVAGTGCYAGDGRLFEMSAFLSDGFYYGGPYSDETLKGNGCVTRSVFTSYPDRTFAPVAIARGSMPGSRVYEDSWEGTIEGAPFMVAFGAFSLGTGCGYFSLPSGMQCDQGYEGNGVPAVPGQDPYSTCSWSCMSDWCGDGKIDPEYGEQCDLGVENGRSRDQNGNIGTCTTLCQIPNIPVTNLPPEAVCQNLELVADYTCGADGSVNGGSTDPEDGPLPPGSCVQSPSGPYDIGTTMVTLTCTDSKGKTDSCEASVTVLDKAKPTLALNGPASELLECVPGTYNDPGATASDVCPAVDLSGSVVVSGTVNPGAVGSYTLTYNVTDSSNNAADPVSRKVDVADTKAPTLTLQGLANERLECGTPHDDPGATASDVCVGNLNAAIVKTGTVNHQQLGSYPITYNVKDPSGNAATEVSRVVTVADGLAPVVTVEGELNPKFECGTGDFNDPGATANDACAGVLPATPDRVVDSNKPGQVVITYSATDPSGNTGTSTTGRTVTVEDTTPPSLALVGPASDILECATDYNDPWATASDLCAGDLSGAITRDGSIDNKLLGNQTLTYNVKDPAGLSATPVSRTVNVRDTLVPVVTVTGPLEQTFECGSGPFPDQGATANDACAGTLPATANQVVNPGQPGTVTITYSATDPSGNTGVSETGRKVTVEDTLPPTLTLAGPSPMPVECADPFNDPGATANDQCAGDLTGSIVKTGTVNSGVVGSYDLGYSVTDPQGLSASATRKVDVADTKAPAITINGPMNIPVECGDDSFADPGATANDACVGSVPAVPTEVVDPGTPGTVVIKYTAQDPSGNVATTEQGRTVTVEDNLPPTLALNGSANPKVECGSPFTDPWATASDQCAGDLTDDIVGTGSVNSGVVGSYDLGYSVTDGKFTASATRKVDVADTLKPVVTVNGPLHQKFECGSGPFPDQGATANDACAGTLTATPDQVVNPGQPGTVTITYSATDPSGNTGVSETGRTVEVEDTLPPTLTLAGPSPMPVECADPFNDPGATANDQCAGDLTGSIVKTGSVNNMQVGGYVLGYSVTDGVGRTASASRQVNVADTKAPAITVNGPLQDSFECGSTYTDPGATANDACAGDVPVTSVQEGNPGQPGKFTITYSAKDPSGNEYVSPVTREVSVNDNEPPVLVLRGNTNEGLECGNPYADPGATANDACFGDVTSRIVVSGSINNKQLGPQKLSYTVTDQAGQTAGPLDRTVTVADTQAPLITVNGPLNEQFECGSGPYADPGATANDACVGGVPAEAISVVNPGQEGTYSVKYKAQDPSGNEAISDTSRIVTVADTLPPSLALNGDDTMPLECATPFNDPGATANDLCAGNVSNRIVVSGSINNKQLGTQSLSYTVTDPGGRSAGPLTRQVNVADTLAPSLTLNGAADDSFECGATYVDPGATASDLCAGDITNRVQSSRTNVQGGFTITYSVTDPSGNAASSPVTRTVKSDDNQPPVLSLNGPANSTLECGNPFTDEGAVASDVCEGDLSGNIQVTGTVNSAVPNTYTLTYTVTDSANNSAAPVNRTVAVQDTLAPTLSLNGQATVGLECGTPYADPGATANDQCYGDLTGSIEVAGTVSHGAVGNYTLTYTVKDPGGRSAAPVSRQVNVSDTQAPVVTVTGPTDVKVECGSGPFNDPGATADDACAGMLTATPSEVVNPGQPGTVSITYSATDPSGNTGTSATGRTVTVEDTLGPTLALIGPGTQELECGNPYTDPGASANDQCEGDLTAAIEKTGSVNNKVLGAQTVTYTVKDSGGRSATPVNRTVNVDDTLAPDITLNGSENDVFECGGTYVDPGATANDLCFGDLTANVQATRTPIPGQPGSFTISYSVTDGAGNTGTSSSSRTVKSEDNTPPVLALNGPATIGLECGSPYSDPGAVANDACSGDLTAAITKTGSVNPNVPNEYTVVYNVKDDAGLSAPSVTRTVDVDDTQAPNITVLGPTEDEFECKTEYQDPGATAMDQCYGDLTSAIVATRTPIQGQPGNFTITYSVQDPSGNSITSPVTRTVRVDDDLPPEISLNGPANMAVECPNQFVDPGATANDLCMGDNIPVTVEGTVDNTTAGTYTLYYSATDSGGNTSQKLIRSVTVQDTQPPAITLNGDDPMKLECNRDTYTEPGATATDLCSGPEAVTATGTVNNKVPDFYAITYSSTDNSGNTLTTVRNVLVEDTLPPDNFTLLGPNPMTLECALEDFVDPGAKLEDLCRGDVSSSVFIEFNGVDRMNEGSYIVRYQGSDGVNAPVFKERAVNVVDTTGPVITLANDGETIECGATPSQGATAEDACYGPVPVKQVPEELPNTPGDYMVTYTAEDPKGNVSNSNGSRKISIVDTTEPVLSLTDQDIYYECTGHAGGNLWEAPVATATDSCAGTIPVHQFNTGDDDEDGIPGSQDPDDFGPGPTTEVEGLYYVQYIAWDENYNSQDAILSVYVQDTIKPNLFLNGEESVQLECYRPMGDVEDPEPYIDAGAIGEDICYGDLSEEVITFGEVNKQVPGVYTLEYHVRDGAYNWADPVVRTVQVKDNSAPAVTSSDRDNDGLPDGAIIQPPSQDFMRTVELSECAQAVDMCEGYMDINGRGTIVEITSNDAAQDADDIVIIDNSTFQVRADLATGGTSRVYEVKFWVTDYSNNTTEAPLGSCQVVVPAQPAPTVMAPADGSNTTDTTPTYTGTVPLPFPAGHQVAVYVDGIKVGTTTPDAGGNWSLTPSAALGAGTHKVSAMTVNAAEVQQSPRSALHSFTVSTQLMVKQGGVSGPLAGR